MVGWHHQLIGQEFEQIPGDGEGQRGLACCGSWGHKESGMPQQLSNNNMTQQGGSFIPEVSISLLYKVESKRKS